MAVIELDYNFRHKQIAHYEISRVPLPLFPLQQHFPYVLLSPHMVAQKGQHIKIYLYTSRPTYLHQDLFIYTKIYLYKSRFTYRHQDIFTYIKISLYISRFLYLYQDLSI